MSSLLLSAASGGIFGAALTASGVYSPSVIISQLQLGNFHMLKSFLAASACSALIVFGANRAKYAKLSPRSDSSYGWFMRYDANLIGGLLHGVGMALTGACPGTVLVQLAMGVRSAPAVAAGCILGAIAFIKTAQRLKRSPPTTTSSSPAQQNTVQAKLGLSTNSMILLYETLCLMMVVAATYLAPTRDHWLNPIVGGLLIGVAQATSVLFTRKTLGVSSAWEDVGKYFWSVVDGTAGPGLLNIVFASGVMAGSKIVSQFIPAVSEAGAPVISPLAAVAGGFAMIFGARLAGGCASGHGISGMATMGLSSFITVAGMFGGGIISALLLR
ncbi:uncharacterized protein Z519_01021 [Cladophialophora bantiana CBS 173.52]|uniref:Sulphur transport domain-containing protein n=1 Tax=Cladophialophora bantiana (strain ATCC 10958 / CBS 173.52 / CDC B-1940 / NIH 8579) TaxID=1442370 RepID=A0A0D2GGG4_CLAB1|nr:uncharacterized protein Z519_01021 [Cladophialophora bantiana CBS 173.52]KIW97437.1 hypothetical protein Z519_01021 [Cladophialophora bantiana CBS 173.52]